MWNTQWITPRITAKVLLVSLLLAIAGCAGSNESPGEFIDDAALTTRVKAAFVADKTVSALNISVESDKGVVHLGGIAKTAEESRQAERIARQTRGVRGVRNNIVVK
jgi:hyperosmotically inducible periplasmic protein